MGNGGWILLAVLMVMELTVMWLLFWSMCRSESQPGATPNRYFGIRNRVTLASDEAWAAGHRAAQPVVTWTGLVTLPLAMVILAFSVIDARAAVLAEAGLSLAMTIWLGIAVSSAAKRAAKSVLAKPEPEDGATD
ncbi:MAG: SdpI family protein [Bifidobacteriaceae bacterium]|jgi:hypothetical protein|nr:SdpI family protein [Bifidobacteriaceae bacterium]